MRRRWADLLAVGALTLLCVTLFRHHLSGSATLVGTSDRLNVAFAQRKFVVDMVHQYGSVPMWNETQFMGFPTYGNVYAPMLNDPLGYLMAAFPLPWLMQVWGVLAFALLLFTGWAAYLYVKDATGSAFAAFIGGSVYAFSAYSTMRVGQIDPVAGTLVQMPLGLLMLRRAQGRRALVYLLGLTAVMLTTFLWSFAQEAAYAVMLFGFYALYRAVQDRSIRPLVVLFVASVVAAAIASPRLYAFYENSRGLGRTSTFVTTCACEGVRWFNDGLFGRFPEEAARFGNAINVHEGFQLYASTFAALLVLVALAFPKRWLGLKSADVPFHVLILASVFLFVLVESARYLMYLAFMKSDLLHSRYTAAGLVPMALLAAVFVEQVVNRVQPRPTGRTLVLTLLGAGLLAGAALWSIDALATSPITAALGLDRLPPVGPRLRLLPAEVMKTLWAIVLFAVGTLVWWRCGRSGGIARLGHQILAYTLVILIVGQGFQFAEFQYSGPHTWTFPVPFKQNNAFMAPTGAFRPPGASALREVHARLETDRYRAVMVMQPGGFPLYGPPGGLEYASHLAELWQLRLVQGYPGIGRRLASLPWPSGEANARSLYFAAGTPLPWELLALLNVKYAVTVNPALYYNFAGGDPARSADAGLADLEVVESPVPVVPREFFSRGVRPVAAGDVSSLLPRDPRAESLVEGLAAAASYPAEGRIAARYHSDRIDVEVEPSASARFLVLNEGYDARWKAYANGQELPIFATNVVMRGLVVPAGVTQVQVRFEPSGW